MSPECPTRFPRLRWVLERATYRRLGMPAGFVIDPFLAVNRRAAAQALSGPLDHWVARRSTESPLDAMFGTHGLTHRHVHVGVGRQMKPLADRERAGRALDVWGRAMLADGLEVEPESAERIDPELGVPALAREHERTGHEVALVVGQSLVTVAVYDVGRHGRERAPGGGQVAIALARRLASFDVA